MKKNKRGFFTFLNASRTILLFRIVLQHKKKRNAQKSFVQRRGKSFFCYYWKVLMWPASCDAENGWLSEQKRKFFQLFWTFSTQSYNPIMLPRTRSPKNKSIPIHDLRSPQKNKSIPIHDPRSPTRSRSPISRNGDGRSPNGNPTEELFFHIFKTEIIWTWFKHIVKQFA